MVTKRCFYCGVILIRDESSPLLRTRDHLLPRSLGGPFTYENIVFACRRCNCDKAARTVEEYRKSVACRCGVKLANVVFYGETLPDAMEAILVRLEPVVSAVRGALA